MAVAALLLVSGTLAAQDTATEGIQFMHGTWAEARAKSAAENKPLFVDIWASWCGPCKRLGKEIFPQKEVGDYFNPRFVCYKLQSDPKDKAMRHEADSIYKEYGVTALPTLLWIAPDGKLMHFSIGFRSAKQLIATAEEAVDPKRNTSFVLSRYEGGDHSLTSGLAYYEVKGADRKGFEQFFLSLPDSDRQSPQMLHHLWLRARLKADSPVTLYAARLYANPATADSLRQTLRMVLFRSIPGTFAAAKDEADEARIAALYDGINISEFQSWRDEGFCERMADEGNWPPLFERVKTIAERNDPNETSLIIVSVYLVRAMQSGKLKRADIPADLQQQVERVAGSMPATDYRRYSLLLDTYYLLGLKDKAQAAYATLTEALEKMKTKMSGEYVEYQLTSAKELIDALK